MTTHSDTAAFRGADVRRSDLSGARFRDCDLRGVRIASCVVDDLSITGFDGATGTVVVDDVDVTAYVRAELDRRHPERVLVRAARDLEELRGAWDELERLWEATVSRARELPEATLQTRVDDEWSFVETVRHLVFAIDTWQGRMLAGEEAPNHPMGLVPTDTSPATAALLGLDPDARPTSDEALAAFADRRARLRAAVGSLTQDELDQPRRALLDPPDGYEERTVRECVTTILREHSEHRRYAVRDLARLEGAAAAG